MQINILFLNKIILIYKLQFTFRFEGSVSGIPVSNFWVSWKYNKGKKHNYCIIVTRFYFREFRESDPRKNFRFSLYYWLLLIWQSPGLPGWQKVNLITVTRRPHHLLFARSEVGSFTCIGSDSPIHGTDGLKSPPKDYCMSIYVYL